MHSSCTADGLGHVPSSHAQCHMTGAKGAECRKHAHDLSYSGSAPLVTPSEKVRKEAAVVVADVAMKNVAWIRIAWSVNTIFTNTYGGSSSRNMQRHNSALS